MSRTIILNSRRRGKAASGIVTPFFEDTFVGLQKNNANGVAYGSTSAGVSVVSFDGRNCLRFRFGPAGNNQEQYYDMGRYLNEVWTEFDLHVPSNFVMAASGGNNKFWTMWRDTYSDFVGGTQQVLCEYTNFTGSPTPIGRMRASRRRTETATPALTGYITDIIGDSSNGTQLIGGTGPILLGAWNRIRFAIRGSSAFGASDGYYKMWANGTLVLNSINQPMHNMYATPSDVKYRWCYLLGSANAHFAEETDFHIGMLRIFENNPGWT